MKIIIIIPCFNDNDSIGTLLENILLYSDSDILIIDDGSYQAISIDSKFTNNIEIIQNKTNRGKGYSLKKGFDYAIKNNYTHAITLDSDLQHNPVYIPEFIRSDQDIDILIGARNFNQNMPFHRRVSNRLTSGIISFLTGKNIKDSQSGYRRYKIESNFFQESIENGFQFESEILINILRKECPRLGYINISTVYNDEKSSINNILDTYKFIKLIIRKFFD